MYERKSAIIGNAIEHAGKDNYFRDVHLFIGRVEDMATIKSAELVRTNLFACLRSFAIIWFTSMLDEDQRCLINLGTSIWVEASAVVQISATGISFRNLFWTLWICRSWVAKYCTTQGNDSFVFWVTLLVVIHTINSMIINISVWVTRQMTGQLSI